MARLLIGKCAPTSKPLTLTLSMNEKLSNAWFLPQGFFTQAALKRSPILTPAPAWGSHPSNVKGLGFLWSNTSSGRIPLYPPCWGISYLLLRKGSGLALQTRKQQAYLDPLLIYHCRLYFELQITPQRIISSCRGAFSRQEKRSLFYLRN